MAIRHLSRTHFDTADAVEMPAGTTAQRPGSPVAGMFRYNTEDDQFEGYTTEWGAIAGSGGGGGSSSVERQTHSADGNTLAFAIGQSITDENNVSVYIDGVYQEKSTFSVSGSTLTFGTGNEPPNGTNVEIISYASVPATTDIGQVQNDTFSITTPTTAFTLSTAPTNKAHTLVYINGVYQEKSTYSISGTTLTLSSSAEIGDTVEVESRKTLAPTGLTYSNLESDLFTATAAQTSFTLVNGTPATKSQTLVYINGVYQNKSTYSLTSGAIVLSTGADLGDEIEAVTMEGLVAPSISPQKYDVSVISASANAVAFYVYVFTADLTLTLPATPEIGQWVKISNRSGVATCVLGRNGNNIMGAALDLTLDTAAASFELIYSGTAQGWVIIGQ
jgi:hypothetical protein